MQRTRNSEELVHRWVEDVRSNNVLLAGDTIWREAQLFNEHLDVERFSTLEGWFTRLKERYCLVFKNVCGERADVEEAACKDWRMLKLTRILTNYAPKDIFNCDEMALFFKALPDKTIMFKGDSCAGGKCSKEWVLVAANMTGIECLPPPSPSPSPMLSEGFTASGQLTFKQESMGDL